MSTIRYGNVSGEDAATRVQVKRNNLNKKDLCNSYQEIDEMMKLTNKYAQYSAMA